MEEKYDLHPQIHYGRLVGYLLYVYNGQEGQRFWETMKLPDGKHIRELVPNMKNVLDIGTGEAKHRRNWAHKFAVVL